MPAIRTRIGGGEGVVVVVTSSRSSKAGPRPACGLPSSELPCSFGSVSALQSKVGLQIKQFSRSKDPLSQAIRNCSRKGVHGTTYHASAAAAAGATSRWLWPPPSISAEPVTSSTHMAALRRDAANPMTSRRIGSIASRLFSIPRKKPSVKAFYLSLRAARMRTGGACRARGQIRQRARSQACPVMEWWSSRAPPPCPAYYN